MSRIHEIDIYRPIESKLPQLIEYFVDFYGEKYRDIITKRLENTIYVYLDTPQSRTYDVLQDYINDLYNKFALKLLKAFNVKNAERNAEVLANYLHSLPKLKECAVNLDLLKQEDVAAILSSFEVLKEGKINNLSTQAKTDLKDILFSIYLLYEMNKEELAQIDKEKSRVYLTEISALIELKPQETRNDEYTHLLNLTNVLKIHDSDLLFEAQLLTIVKNFIHNPETTGAFNFTTLSRYDDKKVISVCVTRNPLWTFDQHIVHELNHIIESDIIRSSRTTYLARTGFSEDLVEKATSKTIKTTPFEYFNEVINDYLSYCVYFKMKNDGFNICFNDIRPSLYSFALPLLDNFIKDNLKEISDCRITKSYREFAKIIGEENYERIASITHELICDYVDNPNLEDCIEEIEEAAGENFDMFAALDHPKRSQFSDRTQKLLSYYELARQVFKDIDKFKKSKLQKKNQSSNIKISSTEEDKKIDNDENETE